MLDNICEVRKLKPLEKIYLTALSGKIIIIVIACFNDYSRCASSI